MIANTLAWRRIEFYRDRANTLKRYVRALCKGDPRAVRQQAVRTAVLASLVSRLSGQEVSREEVLIAANEIFPGIQQMRLGRDGRRRPRVIRGLRFRGGTHAMPAQLTTELAKCSPPNSDERKLADYLAIVDWSQYPGEEAPFRRWVAERTSAIDIATQLHLGVQFCKNAISRHRIKAGLRIK